MTKIKKSSPYIFSVVLGVYILAVLYLTLLPDFWAGGLLEMDPATPRPLFKPIPFATFIDSWDLGFWIFFVQVGGNILMLMPLGFVSGMMQRGWLWVSFVSFLIEINQLLLSIQLGFVYRTFDVDDLWMNILGGAIGFGLYRFLVKKSLI